MAPETLFLVCLVVGLVADVGVMRLVFGSFPNFS